MIENEQQYHVTMAQAEKFVDAIRDHRQAPLQPNVHPALVIAQEEAMRSELDVLQAETAELKG